MRCLLVANSMCAIQLIDLHFVTVKYCVLFLFWIHKIGFISVKTKEPRGYYSVTQELVWLTYTW